MSKNKLFSHSRERGQAIVLLVLVFVALLGITGLAVDGGRLYMERRSLQNAADNAALAGAYHKCQNPSANATAVQTAARTSTSQNGFTHGSNNVEVTATMTGTSSPWDVAVEVKSQPALTIGRLVYKGSTAVSARATARCTAGGGSIGGGNGMIALSPNHQGAITMGSSGCIRVNNGGIFVNSTHATSVDFGGWGPPQGCSEPRMSAQWLQFRGGYTGPGWLTPGTYMNPFPPQSGAPSMADPLLAVPVPSQPAFAAAPLMPGCDAGFISGVYNTSTGNLNLGNHWCTGNNPVTLRPGRYSNFNITSDAGWNSTVSPRVSIPVVLQPGIYYVTGNVSINNDASVVGNGVMFYVPSGSFSVTGSSAANITAPTSGAYSGMSIFMGRTNSNDLRVDGAGVITLRGTIYAPNSRVIMSGSGSTTTLNSQIIALRYEVSGSGAITVNYDASVVYGGGGGNTNIQLTE